MLRVISLAVALREAAGRGASRKLSFGLLYCVNGFLVLFGLRGSELHKLQSACKSHEIEFETSYTRTHTKRVIDEKPKRKQLAQKARNLTEADT